jgi:ApaG protein
MMATRPSPRQTYEAVTRDITVRVRPTYMPAQSEPASNRYVWAYTVEIENRGPQTTQLISRHWIITDARNRVEDFEADGVIGEQPLLKPNEAFRYTSSCPLPTSSGAMRGSYKMVTDGGDVFDAEIPEFSLHLPDATKRMN